MNEELVLTFLAWQPDERMVVRDDRKRSIGEIVLVLLDSPDDSECFLFRGRIATLCAVELPARVGDGVLFSVELLREDTRDAVITSVSLEDERTSEVGCVQAGGGDEGSLEVSEGDLARFVEHERNSLLGELVQRRGLFLFDADLSAPAGEAK